MLNTKTIALSVLLSSILVTPAFASPGDDGCVGNCAPKGNNGGGGQPTNVTSDNTSRNTSRNNVGATTGDIAGSDSGATGGQSNANGTVDGALSNTVGDAVNQGGSLSNVVEGDTMTTLVLPDPVQLSPAMNTQPGMEASCADLAIRADYTGGDTTGVTLYVLSFYNQSTPSDVPVAAQEGFQSVVVCGLSNQVLRLLYSSELDKDVRVAAQRMVLDRLMKSIFNAQGDEYTPRMLDLESVGMNGYIGLPFVEVNDQ